MYKDMRIQASSPEHWENVFIPQRSITLNSWYRKVFNMKRHLFDVQWKEIRQYARPGGRLLDAGCGMGQWVLFLRERGLDAIGLDYSAQMVQLLQGRYPEVDWVQGEIQAMPLADESIDSIISWGVIEHDEVGPQKALKEFYRVLKPGGTIFVTVPFDSPGMRRSSEIQTAASLKNQPEEQATFYQYFMLEKELGCFLTEANFDVIEVIRSTRHYAVPFPHAYVWMQRFGAFRDMVVPQLLGPYLRFRRDSCSMILGVAKKPA